MDDIDLGIDGLGPGELIGSGGFADVYAATDKRLMRRVAVKIVRSSLSPTARRRFDRECSIMGRLSSHPNVVTVYAAGYNDDGRAYLVMELLNDGSLADRVERAGPLPWQQAVAHLLPVLDALQAAHDADILHRDVKPANILLADDGPRLTDFGIAQLQVIDRDVTDELNATWEHTPPETLDDARDERSDVYSAGSTLHTLIAGRSPYWDHHDRKLMSMIHRLVHDPVPVLSAEQAPEALGRAVATALAKDPADRHPSPAAFAAALREVVAEQAQEPPPHWARRLASQLAIPLVTAAVFLALGFAVNRFVVDGGSEAAAGSTGNPYPVGQSVSLFYDDPDLGAEQVWSVRVDDASSAGRAELVVTYRSGADTAPLADVEVSPSDGRGRVIEGGRWCGDDEEATADDARLVAGGSVEAAFCWDDVDGVELLGVGLRNAEGVAYLDLD